MNWYSRLHMFSSTGAYAGFIGTDSPKVANRQSQRQAFLPSSIYNPIPKTLDTFGNIWIDYTSEKVKYSQSGTYIMSFSGGNLFRPDYIDGEGNFYQYDAVTTLVSKYSST